MGNNHYRVSPLLYAGEPLAQFSPNTRACAKDSSLGTLYVAAIWLCYKSSAGLTSSEIWAAGFGVVQPSYIIPFSMTTTLTGIVLLANLPQLLISLAYVFWNNILTSCLLASEYAGMQPASLWFHEPRR